MTHDPDHLSQSVMSVARRDVATLRQELTVQQALDAIRERGVGEKIVYFYVVDTDERLVGVLPTRRLLTAPLGQRLIGRKAGDLFKWGDGAAAAEYRIVSVS